MSIFNLHIINTMYRNKSRFVDRINNLTPMEFITPLLLPVAGYETNKE